MSYDKQTWVDGDLITAEKLNHIEDGIANAGGGTASMTVNVTDTTVDDFTFTLDKTFVEIKAVMDAGGLVAFNMEGSTGIAAFVADSVCCHIFRTQGEQLYSFELYIDATESPSGFRDIYQLTYSS